MEGRFLFPVPYNSRPVIFWPRNKGALKKREYNKCPKLIDKYRIGHK
jgi:hypothetical protein